MVCLRWPLPERRPTTPLAARLGRSGVSGQRQSLDVSRRDGILANGAASHRLHYFRLARQPDKFAPREASRSERNAFLLCGQAGRRTDDSREAQPSANSQTPLKDRNLIRIGQCDRLQP